METDKSGEPKPGASYGDGDESSETIYGENASKRPKFREDEGGKYHGSGGESPDDYASKDGSIEHHLTSDVTLPMTSDPRLKEPKIKIDVSSHKTGAKKFKGGHKPGEFTMPKIVQKDEVLLKQIHSTYLVDEEEAKHVLSYKKMYGEKWKKPYEEEFGNLLLRADEDIEMADEEEDSDEAEKVYDGLKDILKERRSTTLTTDSRIDRESISKIRSEYLIKEQVYFDLHRMEDDDPVIPPYTSQPNADWYNDLDESKKRKYSTQFTSAINCLYEKSDIEAYKNFFYGQNVMLLGVFTRITEGPNRVLIQLIFKKGDKYKDKGKRCEGIFYLNRLIAFSSAPQDLISAVVKLVLSRKDYQFIFPHELEDKVTVDKVLNMELFLYECANLLDQVQVDENLMKMNQFHKVHLKQYILTAFDGLFGDFLQQQMKEELLRQTKRSIETGEKKTVFRIKKLAQITTNIIFDQLSFSTSSGTLLAQAKADKSTDYTIFPCDLEQFELLQQLSLEKGGYRLADTDQTAGQVLLPKDKFQNYYCICPGKAAFQMLRFEDSICKVLAQFARTRNLALKFNTYWRYVEEDKINPGSLTSNIQQVKHQIVKVQTYQSAEMQKLLQDKQPKDIIWNEANVISFDRIQYGVFDQAFQGMNINKFAQDVNSQKEYEKYMEDNYHIANPVLQLGMMLNQLFDFPIFQNKVFLLQALALMTSTPPQILIKELESGKFDLRKLVLFDNNFSFFVILRDFNTKLNGFSNILREDFVKQVKEESLKRKKVKEEASEKRQKTQLDKLTEEQKKKKEDQKKKAPAAEEGPETKIIRYTSIQESFYSKVKLEDGEYVPKQIDPLAYIKAALIAAPAVIMKATLQNITVKKDGTESFTGKSFQFSVLKKSQTNPESHYYILEGGGCQLLKYDDPLLAMNVLNYFFLYIRPSSKGKYIQIEGFPIMQTELLEAPVTEQLSVLMNLFLTCSEHPSKVNCDDIMARICCERLQIGRFGVIFPQQYMSRLESIVHSELSLKDNVTQQIVQRVLPGIAIRAKSSPSSEHIFEIMSKVLTIHSLMSVEGGLILTDNYLLPILNAIQYCTQHIQLKNSESRHAQKLLEEHALDVQMKRYYEKQIESIDFEQRVCFALNLILHAFVQKLYDNGMNQWGVSQFVYDCGKIVKTLVPVQYLSQEDYINKLCTHTAQLVQSHAGRFSIYMRLLKGMIERSKSNPARIGSLDQLDKKVQPYVLDIDKIGLYVFATQLISRNQLVYLIQTIMGKYHGNLSETESINKEVRKFLLSKADQPNYKQITNVSSNCFIYGTDGHIKVNQIGLKLIKRYNEAERKEENEKRGLMPVEMELFINSQPPAIISPALIMCYGYKSSKKLLSSVEDEKAPFKKTLLACKVCRNARCHQVKLQTCKGCKPSAGCYVQNSCAKCRKTR